MAIVHSTATPQIEADRRLLIFKTYEDYLDSLVTSQDRCYLQNTVAARTIAELGYRSSGETLSRQQFEKRLAAVLNYLFPPYKPYELASENMHGGDPLQKELALRERPNRVGILSESRNNCDLKSGNGTENYDILKCYQRKTIVYIRCLTVKGFEISGYMDYAERLTRTNWKPFFREHKRILPRSTDLGFYHWKLRRTMSNNSMNYKVVIDPAKGLLFQNRYDRMVICVDPAQDPGVNTKRIRLQSDMYDHVVIYDHVVRQRI